jgi:hypothetical protein
LRTLFFNDIYDLVEYTIKDHSNDISIIAKYDETRKIIVKFLYHKRYELKDIILNSPDFSGYEDEFVISVINVDGINEIWCEPMKRNGEYIGIESKSTYILANCSSSVIKHCSDSEEVYEVIIGSDDKEEEYQCCGCCSKNDNKKEFKLDSGAATGWKIGNGLISKNKSTYIVNGKKVTKEEFDKASRKFENEFNKMLDSTFGRFLL